MLGVLSSKDLIPSVKSHCMMGSGIKVGLATRLGFLQEEQETFQIKESLSRQPSYTGRKTKRDSE